MYFPIDSIVSLLYVMEDGGSAEIAVVGNDGVVGVRRNDAKPGCGSKRGPRLLPGQRIINGGIHPRGSPPAFIAALYAGVSDPDGADRRLQSTSFIGPAAMPLVAFEHGPSAIQRAGHDAGVLIANMLGARREGVTEAAGRL